MTSVHSLEFEPIDLPDAPEDRPPARALPSWLPGKLWMHLVALGVVLFALVPLLDNGSMVSADEGAVLTQLEILHTTGSWGLDNPLPSVDPDGRWFGIEKSDRNGDTFFPYAKHAAYPSAMRPLFGLGGQRLVIAASALGTLLTALFAALLARRIRPPGGSLQHLDLATLWVVGVVSPLFFDSFWVIAHSIGAAFATGAILAAVVAITDRRLWMVALLAVGIAGAALFRSEGMLLGVALAAACGLAAVSPVLRERRVAAIDVLALVAGVVSGAAGLGSWWLDSKIATSILGTPASPFSIHGETSSWIADRLQGMWATLIRPQILAPTAAGGIFLAVAALMCIAAAYARFRPSEITLIRGAAGLAGLGALAALAFRVAPVPGLLVAFPLLPAAIIMLRREQFAPVAALVAITTAGLYALATIGTQYAIGGSMEWGGRYFHMALPALVPVLLVSLAAAGARLDPITRRIGAGALAASALVLTVFAVGSIVRLHDATGHIVDEVTASAAATSEATTPSGPVVVTNMGALGRLAWDSSVHGRYLSVERSRDLPVVAGRLADAGIDEFVFAAPYRPTEDRARLHGYAPVAGTTRHAEGWTVTIMRRVPAGS